MKEKISVQSFVEEFLNKKIKNTKATPTAVEDFIRNKLDIVEYLPFQTKREIVEMLVATVVIEEDGIKRVDSVAQFLSFIVAMLASHTTLVFGDKPEEDYDALSKNGLLEHIIAMFQRDYNECDALFKAAIADELADNNLSVILNKFLNAVLGKLEGSSAMLKGFAEKSDISKILGEDINKEDLIKLIGFLDKLK